MEKQFFLRKTKYMHNIRAVLEHGFRAAFCCLCVNGMDFDQVTVKVVNSNDFIVTGGESGENSLFAKI